MLSMQLLLCSLQVDYALYERKEDMKDLLRNKLRPYSLELRSQTYRCPLNDCSHEPFAQSFRNKASLYSHLLQRHEMPCLTCDAVDHLWKRFYASKTSKYESEELRQVSRNALIDGLKAHFDAITRPNHAAVLNGCLDFANKFF